MMADHVNHVDAKDDISAMCICTNAVQQTSWHIMQKWEADSKNISAGLCRCTCRSI